MTRLITNEATGPTEIKIGNESRWICMCGLSKHKPFCDGSHKKTAEEEHGKMYKYHEDGTRVELL